MRSPDANSSVRRVSIIAPLPPPYGGMSLQAEKLGRLLAAEGLAVKMVPTNPPFPRALRFAESVPGLRTGIRELLYVISLVRAIPRARVVHHLTKCGLYFFLLTVPVVFLGSLCKRKIVLNYRGGRAPMFLRRWSWLAIPVMRLADAVVVPSDFLQRVFQSYGLTTQLLPNIVDTELFPYKPRERFAPRLIVTRHLEPLYNVACIVRAFRVIKARFPDVTLAIVGTGSEEGKLRQLVADWKLSGVTFHGPVPHNDLPGLYAQNHIFVNSSMADNFPGALVEAACCGLPIVTTGAGGIPDMIRHRETGLLVALDDHEALAAGVIELVENAELAHQLAVAARRWAAQFSWRSMFSRLMAYYGFKNGRPIEGSEVQETSARAQDSLSLSGRE